VSTATGATVLLLEDDDGVREVLSCLLADDGHDVQACTSTQEILDRAVVTLHPLAVVDFWGASYLTLVAEERVQLADLARTVPTVLVTACSWASPEVAQELGLAALVRMPFDVGEVSEVVRSCVAQAQAASAAPARR
jgi:DNA-binding NtrC family response regulator